MRVLNRHTDSIPRDAVYVGRGTPFGNKFQIGPDGTRDEVIAKFRAWAPTDAALMAALPTLAGKDLVCSCRPRACHADVLIEMANPGYDKDEHMPF
jgi:hypothetical protein